MSLASVGSLAEAQSGDSWPHWRGPHSTGVAEDGDPPIRWSETENVCWKTRIPGRGNASPIVWRDLVFVLTVSEPAPATIADSRWGGNLVPDGPVEFQVVALDRDTGQISWSTTARTAIPREKTHARSSWAPASATTDGEVLIASFGSNGIFAFDLKGEMKWQRDFGESRVSGVGEGSSPVIHRDSVVINWDHYGDSFIIALDRLTGETRWRRERDEPVSWSTPLVVEADGRTQVIVNATRRIRSYDLTTGEEIWSVSGMTSNVIPTPSYANGLVYLMSGFRDHALMAVRLRGARGDLDGSDAIVWSHRRDTSFLPSGLTYDDAYYFLKVNSGILTSLDAKTGQLIFGPTRLPGIQEVYASPVGAAGRIYITATDGTTLVLKKGPELEVLATNTLDDGFDASAAVAGRQLFLRGQEFLYCLEERQAPRIRQDRVPEADPVSQPTPAGG